MGCLKQQAAGQTLVLYASMETYSAVQTLTSIATLARGEGFRASSLPTFGVLSCLLQADKLLSCWLSDFGQTIQTHTRFSPDTTSQSSVPTDELHVTLAGKECYINRGLALLPAAAAAGPRSWSPLSLEVQEHVAAEG